MRTVTILCRTKSRNGLSYYAQVAHELPKRGVRIEAVHMVTRRKELRARVREAARSNVQCVVLIGGDGSQTAAAGELAHTNTVLAVVPAGTGNSFALGLGIKNDVEQAIETIVNGRETCVDLGTVNGKYFANFATIGILARAANETRTGFKRWAGPLAYGLTALAAFFGERPFDLDVRWKKHRLQLRTHEALLSCGRYFGWQPLTPDASVQSGHLAFFAAAGGRAIDLFESNAALLLGEHTRLRGAQYFSAKKVVVRANPRQPINIDGHACGKTPARFEIVPRALRVLVPQELPKA